MYEFIGSKYMIFNWQLKLQDGAENILQFASLTFS